MRHRISEQTDQFIGNDTKISRTPKMLTHLKKIEHIDVVEENPLSHKHSF